MYHVVKICAKRFIAPIGVMHQYNISEALGKGIISTGLGGDISTDSKCIPQGNGKEGLDIHILLDQHTIGLQANALGHLSRWMREIAYALQSKQSIYMNDARVGFLAYSMDVEYELIPTSNMQTVMTELRVFDAGCVEHSCRAAKRFNGLSNLPLALSKGLNTLLNLPQTSVYASGNVSRRKVLVYVGEGETRTPLDQYQTLCNTSMAVLHSREEGHALLQEKTCTEVTLKTVADHDVEVYSIHPYGHTDYFADSSDIKWMRENIASNSYAFMETTFLQSLHGDARRNEFFGRLLCKDPDRHVVARKKPSGVQCVCECNDDTAGFSKNSSCFTGKIKSSEVAIMPDIKNIDPATISRLNIAASNLKRTMQFKTNMTNEMRQRFKDRRIVKNYLEAKNSKEARMKSMQKEHKLKHFLQGRIGKAKKRIKTRVKNHNTDQYKDIVPDLYRTMDSIVARGNNEFYRLRYRPRQDFRLHFWNAKQWQR